MQQYQSQLFRVSTFLDAIWELDHSVWILEKTRLMRRFKLGQQSSIQLEFDSKKPLDLPCFIILGKVMFNAYSSSLGPESETRNYKTIMSKNIDRWNPKNGLLSNLKLIFQVDSFPQKVLNDSSHLVECNICFDTGHLSNHGPDISCPCGKQFHPVCLVRESFYSFYLF